jgi:3-hydroxyisobutyrate dehydrogenase-like beta-hydroxyacid dehydrogenase
MRLAFIGLGRMGSGMARSLLRAGHQLTLYNRSREKAGAIDAPLAATPAEACRDAEAVVTMLADDAAEEQVVFGQNGILDSPALHIASSTISVALARRLAAAHEGRYLSAPVFGRPEAAEKKEILVVPAGPDSLVERFRPVFDAIGRRTFVAGQEPWQANAVKLCGNFMIASMIETFGEAYATLRKAGVDPHLFLDVMSALFGSPVYANYGRIIADGAFDTAGFALKLGLKDIRLALEAAFELGSPMPIASLLRDRLLDAQSHGQAGKDWSAVANWGR